MREVAGPDHEPIGAAGPELQSQVLALYISALNDMIDLGESRLNAVVYARVPQTIIRLLVAGASLMLCMVGFPAGLTGRRSLIGAVVLGAVITLVVDLDRPRRGFLQVSQQPLIDVQQQIGPPSRGWAPEVGRAMLRPTSTRRLLPRHRDPQAFLRVDEVAVVVIAEIDLDPIDAAAEPARRVPRDLLRRCRVPPLLDPPG